MTMELERMKRLKETLLGTIEGQVNGHLAEVDAKELGEVVDIVKDLSEAIYYCVVTEAMEKGEKEGWHEKKNTTYYYTDRMVPRQRHEPRERMNEPRDMDRTYYPNDERDMREGRSPSRRKRYMEGKEMHHDKLKQMQELEEYMQELTSDLTEMIEDASPEEKTLLQQKISMLATKIK